jgi:hypothetical protein
MLAAGHLKSASKGRTKLYAMLSTGELESSKLGRRRVIIDRSIVALLDRTSVSPAATCLINPRKSGQPRRRQGRGERQERRSDRGDAAAAAPQVDEGPTT